jgi:hypothetical protein
MDISKMSAIKGMFTFIGSGIKMPSYSNHPTVWEMFPRPSSQAAGYNTTPPVWK